MTMHFKKAFPGKYLQTTDLDRPIYATISHVTTETVGAGADAERKPVAHFKEAGIKALVLNLTKCEAIAGIAGSDDTDDWVGACLQLSRGETRYQGKKVGCIVVTKAPGDDEAF
jgi:hypothetical protein